MPIASDLFQQIELVKNAIQIVFTLFLKITLTKYSC